SGAPRYLPHLRQTWCLLAVLTGCWAPSRSAGLTPRSRSRPTWAAAPVSVSVARSHYVAMATTGLARKVPSHVTPMTTGYHFLLTFLMRWPREHRHVGRGRHDAIARPCAGRLGHVRLRHRGSAARATSARRDGLQGNLPPPSRRHGAATHRGDAQWDAQR